MLINNRVPSEFRDDKGEIASIQKNEKSDMKGKLTVDAVTSHLFPTIGPVFMTYTFIKLFFQIIMAFVLPFRLAFLPEIEYWPYVYLDFVTDFFFLVDMIIIFNLPIFEDSKHVTSRKRIAKKYLKFWFWIDLYCLFPMSYFRMRSMSNPRNPNNLQNLLTLNFKSLPRFYPMMVILRMSRMRGITENLHRVFKITRMKVQVQMIFIDLFYLAFVMHICGCFL